LKLTHVTLVNLSNKTVLGLTIAWNITTKQDRRTILRRGYPGLFETYLLPGEKKKFECPVVDFAQNVRFSRFEGPLAKNGVLDGDYLIQVRVQEVEFDDGSNWEEWNAEALIDKSHHATTARRIQTCDDKTCSYANVENKAECARDVVGDYWCEIHGPWPADGVYCECDITSCQPPPPPGDYACAEPPPRYPCETEIPDTSCPYNVDTTGCHASPVLHLRTLGIAHAARIENRIALSEL
jgi:hypothetical protein